MSQLVPQLSQAMKDIVDRTWQRGKRSFVVRERIKNYAWLNSVDCILMIAREQLAPFLAISNGNMLGDST